MKTTELTEMFNKYSVLTLIQIADAMNRSVRTVQRQLTKLGVLRSYNKNSRFCTIPEIPEFDQNGIWNYQGICFSRFGNLRETVIALVVASECGLSGNEIGGIVQLSPRSFLHHFRNLPELRREKHGGVFVYYSQDPEKYADQKSRRKRSSCGQLVSDAIAVRILVEYIKNPEFTVDQLAAELKRQGPPVSSSTLFDFLLSHGLLKKTPVGEP